MDKTDNGFKANVSMTDDGLGITIDALFKGLQGIAQTRTVVGDPIHAGNILMVPLIEISAGMASGAFGKSARKDGAAAMTTKLSPVAMLVMENGRIRIINVKNQDIATKVCDMVPDIINRLTGKGVSSATAEEAASKLEAMDVEIISPEEP